MRTWIPIFLVLIVVAAVAFTFTVDERQFAMKLRFGEIVETSYEPGLHFKLPVVNSIVKFDRRILNLDARPDRFITSEKKFVEVDSFVKWRIADPSAYFTATGGDQLVARDRLGQIIKDGLRAQFAKRTVVEVVSVERDEITEALKELANERTRGLGIEVVDVRTKRINLPEEVSHSVYNRMRSERTRVANELRSEGLEAAERIRADADRRAEVLLAESQRDAELTRGEGDATAAEQYAAAYEKNAEFYGFYRSLQAYRSAIQGKDNILVLDPDSEFFEYFRGQKTE